MNIAYVLTNWAGDGLTQETAYGPQLSVDYPEVTYEDITAQSADIVPFLNPNQYIIKVVCDDVILDALETSPNYYVISSEVVE